MSQAVTSYRNVFLIFVFAVLQVGFTGAAFGQCATTVPPVYSSTCTNQYFTSITASGAGVVSTIGASGSSCVTSYYDYFATQGITAPAGATVDINFTRFTTTYIGYLWVYVDWNNNGLYEASELAGTMMTLPAPVLSSVYSFTIPTSSIATGTNLHMRMMLSETSAGAPCTANWGETDDFYINVPCIGPAPITGVAPVCAAASIPLSDTDPGGSWSSANAAVATVDAVTGIVYGVAAGTTGINYTIPGGCTASATITVNPGPGPISGPSAVCNGVSIQLSNAVGGGVWTSDDISVATVSAVGSVSGVSSGAANISYTFGSCSAVLPVTVNTVLPITGGIAVCAGLTLPLSDATPSGVWSSASTSAATVSSTGVVTGVASGSAAIYYTVAGCYVSVLVTVGPALTPVSGPSSVCSGSSITLVNGTPGGTWSSSNAGVATASAAGIVAGISQGTASITYSAGGCSVQTTVTVVPGDAGVMSGPDSVCAGVGHEISLSSTVTGGVWSSTNTARATVDPASGIVSGVSTGIDTIKYTISNSCGTFVIKKGIYVRSAARCATGVAATVIATHALSISPNPCHGSFTFMLAADKDEDLHVVVTNITGQTVKEFTAKANSPTQVILDGTAGVYLLSVTGRQGRLVEKVVVQ